MEIAVVGVNHRIAPIGLREKLAFTESKKVEAFNVLRDLGISELIVISTCNRTELYFAAEEIDDAVDNTCSYLQRYSSIKDIRNYLIVKRSRDAVYHIFKVAAGLDSLVIGEDQILGQVKDALIFAMENSHSGKLLNKLFREAVTKAKYIKSKYKISENPTSVGYAGIKMIKEKISLQGKSALIIGAGNMGKLTLRYLIEEKMERIYVTNRTHNRLNTLLDEFKGITIVDYEDRYEYLKEVDLLISTTASPHTIFVKDKIPRIDKRLYILDLALPRDVDESVGLLENVDLYGIDDLKRVVDENVEHRRELVEPIIQEIDSGVKDFCAWKRTVIVDPVLRKLFRRCEEIQRDTVEVIYRKTNISSRDKEIIEKMISSAIKRNVKPILNLKTIDDEEKLEKYISLVNELFGV